MSGPLGQQMSTPVYETESGRTVSQEAPPANYWKELFEKQAKLLERLSRQGYDKSHPVDEYISTTGYPENPDNNGVYRVIITPTWMLPEKIESILYTLPAGTTSAILRLADRRINLFPDLPGADPAATVNGYGSLATPGAGAAIASAAAVPIAGYYSVSWQTRNNAAVTNGNNYAIFVNGVEVPGAVGLTGTAAQSQPVVQTPIQVYVPQGGIISVNAIAADGLGTYTAALAATLEGVTDYPPLASPYTNYMNGLSIIINEDDERYFELTGTFTAGPTHIELMGHADEIYGNA